MAVQLAGKANPTTPLEGKFSTAYCAALALNGYAAAALDFSPERLRDRSVRNLLPRVRLNVVPQMAKTAASMTVRFVDGTRLAAETPLALGNPGNPMQWADMEQKFLGLVEPILGSASASMLRHLRRFDRPSDVDGAFGVCTGERLAAE
jgi:2-methylcitrate dehydratase PrpD